MKDEGNIMKKENTTKNFAGKIKDQYEERQETVLGMFLKQEPQNPADYYLRAAKEKKENK